MRAALQASLAGRSLTEILIANGALSEHDLAHTLAEHHGLDHIDLDVFAIDDRATALVDPYVARRLGAVPVAFLADETVVVALHEPNGSTAAVELAHLTGRTIQPAVASRSQIEAVVRDLAGNRRPRIASVRTLIDRPAAEDRRPPAPSLATGQQGPPPTMPVHVPPPTAAQSPPSTPAAAPTDAGPSVEHGADHLSLHFDGLLETLHQRAEIAETRRHEADERTGEARELARVETARADAAERRATAAQALVDAAEARSREAAGAVGAANEALARLLRACEILERQADARSPAVEALHAEVEALRAERDTLRAELESERDDRARLEVRLLSELETERGERARLEVQLRQPPARTLPVAATSPRKLRRAQGPRKRGG